jgi:hypothetical protein
MSGAAAATRPAPSAADRQTRKRPAIIQEQVQDVLRIYDGPADKALPSVEAALEKYAGQNVCISIVAATRLNDLVRDMGKAGTLEERMRSRLAEMEKTVANLNSKEGKRAKGLTLEEYDVREACQGAIEEIKDLLGIS